MVDLEPVLGESEQQAKVPRDVWHLGDADEVALKRLIEAHARITGSQRAQAMLKAWADYRPRFVKVFPKEYRRALAELAASANKVGMASSGRSPCEWHAGEVVPTIDWARCYT